jgi:DnaD/phage-associated family protein
LTPLFFLTPGKKYAIILAVIEISYTINWAAAQGAAAMPKAAADCLKLSSGIAAKVFIYITVNEGAAAAEIAEATGVAAEDVTDALLFWERAGLLLRTGEKATKTPERRRTYAPDKPTEIAEAAEKNVGIKDVYIAAEKILGRVLRPTEMRVFAGLLEEINIPPDILILIIDFAVSASKYSANYIDVIARDWSQRGITSHSEAEAEIMRIRELNSLELQVKTRFGLNQTLTKTQMNYVSQWADKGYGIETIMSAFDTTVDRIGKADFKYISKVLVGGETEGRPQKRVSGRQKDDPSFSYGDFGEKTIERILRETEEVYV